MRDSVKLMCLDGWWYKAGQLLKLKLITWRFFLVPIFRLNFYIKLVHCLIFLKKYNLQIRISYFWARTECQKHMNFILSYQIFVLTVKQTVLTSRQVARTLFLEKNLFLNKNVWRNMHLFRDQFESSWRYVILWASIWAIAQPCIINHTGTNA